jgi:hypothetical protein
MVYSANSSFVNPPHQARDSKRKLLGTLGSKLIDVAYSEYKRRKKKKDDDESDEDTRISKALKNKM